MDDKDALSHLKASSGVSRLEGLVVIVIAMSLGAPVFEKVQSALEPRIGNWPAFAIGVLGAIIVVVPAGVAAGLIVRRERDGRKNDLSPMCYRPAIFPLWIFTIAAIKNIRDFAELIPWIYLGLLLVFLAAAAVIQRRRGSAWSWWIAVPVGALIGLIVLPLAGFITWIVAPDQMQPE